MGGLLFYPRASAFVAEESESATLQADKEVASICGYE
jgi:hypothetical protein